MLLQMQKNGWRTRGRDVEMWEQVPCHMNEGLQSSLLVVYITPDSESWQGVRKVVIAEVEAERQAAEKAEANYCVHDIISLVRDLFDAIFIF